LSERRGIGRRSARSFARVALQRGAPQLLAHGSSSALKNALADLEGDERRVILEELGGS